MFLAFWHIGICLLLIASRQKKKCLKSFGPAGTPPPLWKKLIFEQHFFRRSLPSASKDKISIRMSKDCLLHFLYEELND